MIVTDLAQMLRDRVTYDDQFQAACQRYAHENGSSSAIAAAAVQVIRGAFDSGADDAVSATTAKPVWRCYHCDETFTDDCCARLHFGRDEDSLPACQIKAGAEQGLLGALRDAEYDAADARRAIADESTDAAKAYYAQASRHDRALKAAEEAGYERGIADAHVLNKDQAVGAEAIFEWVAARSHPSVATAWTCGLAATTLAWMLRLVRLSPVVMTDTVQGVGHMWVEMDGRYYDPTIGQFGEFPGSGLLPHPLSATPAIRLADGHVLVPAIATREMVDAADACTDAYSAYAAMVEVARVR